MLSFFGDFRDHSLKKSSYLCFGKIWGIIYYVCIEEVWQGPQKDMVIVWNLI